MLRIGHLFTRHPLMPVCPVVPGQPPAVMPIKRPAPPGADQEKELKEAPLVGVDVRVELVDYAAQVRQTQRFRNNNDAALEATYEFELPKGCAVSLFSADVGERHLEGVVKRKEQAADDYDDALAAGSTAALLQSKDESPNTFCVSLGNVPPGAEAFVTLAYEQLAAMEDDHLVLVLDGEDARSVVFAEPPPPCAATDARVAPGFNFAVHVATRSAVRSVSSPSHPVAVELDGDGHGATVRLAEGADWRTRKNFVLEATVADPHEPCVRVQQWEAQKDAALVAMASFYPRIERPDTRCEMVFVLDRSGSMSGSPIQCAKSTLQYFLRSLPEGAYFNIVSFGTGFERFSPEAVPYNDKTLEQAAAHVDGFKANLGGTNIYDPLSDVFKQPTRPGYPRQVFVLTDGDVNNKEQCVELVRRNAHTTRVFAFGIGSGVDRDLVDGMARAGEGSSAFVRDSVDIRSSVMKQLARALQPGLTDTRVQWLDAATDQPLPGVAQAPTRLPPVFRGTRLVAFALLPAAGGPRKLRAVLTGSFGDAQYRSVADFDADAAAARVPGQQVAKLAARALIRDAEEAEPPRTDDAVALSLRFGVLCKGTAFVAVGSGGEALEASMITRPVRRRQTTHQTFGFGAPMSVGCASMSFGFGAAMKSKKRSAPRCAKNAMKSKKSSAPRCAKNAMPEAMAMPMTRGMMPMAMAAPMAMPPQHMNFSQEACISPPAALAGAPPPPALAGAPAAAAAPRAPAAAPQDVLDKVVFSQMASGCFKEEALGYLGLALEALAAVPTELPAGVDSALARSLWVTLLVVAALNKHHSSRRAEWEPIANKSSGWARSKLGSAYDTWVAAAQLEVP